MEVIGGAGRLWIDGAKEKKKYLARFVRFLHITPPCAGFVLGFGKTDLQFGDLVIAVVFGREDRRVW